MMLVLVEELTDKRKKKDSWDSFGNFAVDVGVSGIGVRA